jgi:hypothetical protein
MTAFLYRAGGICFKTPAAHAQSAISLLCTLSILQVEATILGVIKSPDGCGWNVLRARVPP